jgi:hypothetical protein
MVRWTSWCKSNAPIPPGAVNGVQHIANRATLSLAPKNRDNRNKRQRHQPDDGKEQKPPEEADEVINDESKNAVKNCFQHRNLQWSQVV